MEVFVLDVNKSSVSSAQVYVPILRSVLCLGKIHENTPIKHCMGAKIGVVQKCVRICQSIFFVQ